jgi:hypothetical protein
MSDAGEGTAIQRIVRTLAATYQRQGYHQIAVPASALLSAAGTLPELETALATLLDDGGVMPVGSNGVALHPSARVALLNRTVLEKWHQKVSLETGPKLTLYRDGIAAELATLVAWASGVQLPDDLTVRAAGLAGVLATIDLDPRALDIVATHGGTARGRLAALAAMRPRSIGTDRLRDHLRHNVSSAYPSA